MDAQGPDAARPYAEPTLGMFPTVIDAENVLGDAFGFKAIPNGVLIGADGRLDGTVAGGFEIRQDATRELVERWLSAEDVAIPEGESDHEWSAEALGLFRDAGAAVRRGERDQAVDLLKQAYPLEPDNFIIRKQLWAIEHPEKFYEGDVDYGWQRKQLEAGR
jgi:hypothetical protein